MQFTYQVGQRFPDARYQGLRDGAVLRFLEGSFDVIASMTGPRSDEIKQFRQGLFRVGLYTHRLVPFLVFSVGIPPNNYTLDAPANAHKFVDTWQPPVLSTGEGLLTNFFLINADSYRLEAMRTVSLPASLVDALGNTLVEQKQAYASHQAVDTIISEAWHQVDTPQMLAAAREQGLVVRFER